MKTILVEAILLTSESYGPFKCYVTEMGGGIQFSGVKRYEGVRFNVITGSVPVLENLESHGI